jgi:hypothetical protein
VVVVVVVSRRKKKSAVVAVGLSSLITIAVLGVAGVVALGVGK